MPGNSGSGGLDTHRFFHRTVEKSNSAAIGLYGTIEEMSRACLLLAIGCLSSQIAIETLGSVPLWKVIVGSRADELNRARKGPVFL